MAKLVEQITKQQTEITLNRETLQKNENKMVELAKKEQDHLNKISELESKLKEASIKKETQEKD